MTTQYLLFMLLRYANLFKNQHQIFVALLLGILKNNFHWYTLILNRNPCSDYTFRLLALILFNLIFQLWMSNVKDMLKGQLESIGP